jgi:hypothetical protein
MNPNNEPPMGGVPLCGQISKYYCYPAIHLEHRLQPSSIVSGLPNQTTKGSTADSCPVTSLQDALHNFYARVEVSNTVSDDFVITLLSAADVSKTFKKVNIHKAAGPDGLPRRVLQACADQLARVFTVIFNPCLSL